MTTKMSKKFRVYLIGTIAIACAASGSAVAWAGVRTGASVTIGGPPLGPTTAEGTIGTVHNSASTTEFIGCYASTNSTDVAVSCTARTSGGMDFSCTSNSPNLFAAVNGINPDSHLSIVGFNGGACESVRVWHYSTHYTKSI